MLPLLAERERLRARALCGSSSCTAGLVLATLGKGVILLEDGLFAVLGFATGAAVTALTFAPKTTEELDFATEGKGTGAEDAGCKDGAQPPWRFDGGTLEAAIGDAEPRAPSLFVHVP